ncbi:MAG: phage tail protein [Planctomycetota bacterium]
MKTGISINFDRDVFAQVQRELAGIPRAMDKASVSAVNKAEAGGRAVLSKNIRKDTPIKAAEIKKRTTIRKANRSTGPVARVQLEGRALNSIVFQGRPKSPPNQRGIRVSQRRGRVSAVYSRADGRKTFDGAFVQRMPNGKVGIFVRKPGRTASGNAKIRAHYGPDITTLAKQSGAVMQTKAALVKRLRKELLGQVGRFVDKINKS